MTAPRPYRILWMLVPLLGACGGTQEPPPSPSPMPGPVSAGEESSSVRPSSPSDTLTNAQIEAIYRARQDSMEERFTAADVRFMTHMIHHHAQAIEMARMAATHGASPQIRTLAARILNTQQGEIELMQRWLRERGQPVPEVLETGEVMGHAGHARMDMPGILSPEQLERLDRARGEAFDRLFLTSMIEHHSGAVEMVHELFATDGAAQGDRVFAFASDVQVDQSTEIARMQRMLSDM